MITVGERLLITLWVGALWSIGYLAIPTLFATLPDRMLAGMLAGRMFTPLSYIGLVCGGLLLAGEFYRHGLGALRRPRGGIVLLMLVLVAVGQFWLQPIMVQLKSGGLVEESAQAAAFARLHGISATLFLINSLCGALLVALETRRVSG